MTNWRKAEARKFCQRHPFSAAGLTLLQTLLGDSVCGGAFVTDSQALMSEEWVVLARLDLVFFECLQLPI